MKINCVVVTYNRLSLLKDVYQHWKIRLIQFNGL